MKTGTWIRLSRARLVLGLGLMCLCSLSACTSSTDAPEVPTAVLRIGLDTAPQHLDPRFGLDAASYKVSQLLYNGLVRLDAQARIVPELALSWDTPDATTYIFHLRRDVRWHDGRPFTAADVHYTFTSLLDPKTQSPKRVSFDKIRSVDVLAEDRVQFVLSEPFAPFLSSNMTLPIIPWPREGEAPQNLDAHPIGTGPFVFVKQEPDVSLHLQANAAYFESKPSVDEVVFRILPDAMVRWFELQKGNIDLLQNVLPPDLLSRLGADSQYNVVKSPGTNFMYVGLNSRDPILRHVQVRQALAHAIDRQALIQHVLHGLAQPADGILPAGHWAYEPHVSRYAYDPERAAQLLDAAGFADPDGEGPQARFQLQYKTSQNEVGRRIAEVIQESLRKVGVAIEIRSYEWGTFFGDIRAGNFQLYALTWVGVTDPDIFHYVLHSQSIPPAGANRGHYVSPRLDTLLEQGRRATTLEQRRALYSEAQAIIAAELPYIPLWHDTNVAVLRTLFTGYSLTPAGDYRAIQSIRRQPPDRSS
jgi:peptide/nickel transport system substrate-binding protein